jgi:hypothetical protein
MFGAIYRLRPRPGEEAAVEESFRRWQDRRARAPGAVAEYLLRPSARPGELVGIALFESEYSFRREADDTARTRWLGDLRARLESDPEWDHGRVMGMGRSWDSGITDVTL